MENKYLINLLALFARLDDVQNMLRYPSFNKK